MFFYLVSGKPLSVQPGSIKGIPKPSVTWFKNGEMLQNSPRLEIDPITGRLLFVTVTLDDGGKYVLRAENEAGYDEIEVDVNILEAPSISTDSDMYEVTLGQQFSIDLD